MQRSSDPSYERPTYGHPPMLAPVRTYEQIAMILAQRKGTSISPSHVQRVCEAAEQKLAQAMLVAPAQPTAVRHCAAGRPCSQGAKHPETPTAIAAPSREPDGTKRHAD